MNISLQKNVRQHLIYQMLSVLLDNGEMVTGRKVGQNKWKQFTLAFSETTAIFKMI